MMFLIGAAALLLLATTPSVHAWCNPGIVTCYSVIDSNTAQGHTDVSRYNCTGTTNWYGKAHVFRLDHLGGEVWITLEWSVDDPSRELGLFVLGSCDRNDCIAYDPHYIYMNAPAGDYWIIIDGRNTFTIHYVLTIHCGDNPLPVEMTSFDAASESDGVRLRWTVASERDNEGFEIQRANASADWTTIGYVPGRGTAATSASYGYTDDGVSASNAYDYRLLALGMGGERNVVGSLTVTYVAPQEAVALDFRFLGNYPNPFNPSTTLRFEMNEAADVTLNVFDLNGRLVSRLLSGTMTAGTHEVRFDAEGLPSGLYLAQLTGDSQSDLLKMILLK